MIVDGNVRFVCTDRGTHPSRELAKLRVDERGLPPTQDEVDELRTWMSEEQVEDYVFVDVVNSMVAQSHDGLRRRHHGKPPREGAPMPSYVSAPPPGDRLKRWQFRCPTCRRDLQLKHSTVCRLVEAILKAQPDTPVPRVDISLLPY